MATTDIITPWRERGPLFVIAGAHGSLHWAMAVFYLLLPFIKTEYGLSYTEIGLLTSVAHISSFATNIPSGMIVDVTGRRMECQLTALVLGGLAIVAIGWVSGFLALAAAIALISSMNTLWHPAAISYLSASFPNRRGMALAFHTVGASLGDAAAPLAAGVLIAAIGWRDTAMLSGAFPIAAALLMLLVFGRRGPPTPVAGEPTSGVKSYFADLGQLMRKANTWTICIMAGFRSTSQTGIRTFLPLYFYAAFNPDPFMLGVLLMTLQASGAATTPFAGAISDKIGRRPILMAGFAGSAAFLLALPSITSLPVLVTLVGFAGIFIFAVRPVIQSWALDMTPPRLGGSITSLLFGTQSLFAIAVPIIGGVIADRWGLEYVFYALAGSIVVATFVSMTITDD